MANFLSPILRPIGMDPSQGYDTAAAGAANAQKQANTLSDLQWSRQMGGLGQAQGFVGNLQALYNQIYSPGGGQAAPGGMPVPMASQGQPGAAGAMSSLQPQTPPLTYGHFGSVTGLSPPGGPQAPMSTFDKSISSVPRK